MKRKWENHELIEHWTIDTEERGTDPQEEGSKPTGGLRCC